MYSAFCGRRYDRFSSITMIDQYTRPDFKNIALITIDVQRDFLDDGVCAVPGTTAVLPAIARLLAAFRQARLPIIHVARIYRADGGNVDLCRRAAVESGIAIARPGTPGIELADALPPLGAASLDSGLLLSGDLQQLGEGEWAMYKSRWGAFYRTRLRGSAAVVGRDDACICRLQFFELPAHVHLRGKRTRFPCGAGGRCRLRNLRSWEG